MSDDVGGDEYGYMDAVRPNQKIPVSEEFLKPPPKEKQVQYDNVTLKVTDGADREVNKVIDFEWLDSDEFKEFRYAVAGGDMDPGWFYPDQTAVITSRWEISENADTGNVREIAYFADGRMIGNKEKIAVAHGGEKEHIVKLNLKNRKPGHTVKIRALLINPKTRSQSVGEDDLMISADKDTIQSAEVRPHLTVRGNPVWVYVSIKTGRGKGDGVRTLKLKKPGRKRTVWQGRLEGEESTFKIPGFGIDTAPIIPGSGGAVRYVLQLSSESGYEDRWRGKFTLGEIAVQGPGGGADEEADGTGTGQQKFHHPGSYAVLLEDKYNIKHIGGFKGYKKPYPNDNATNRITVCGLTMYVDEQALEYSSMIADQSIYKAIYPVAPEATFRQEDGAKALAWSLGSVFSSLGSYANKTPEKRCGYAGSSRYDEELERLKQQQQMMRLK